MKTYVRLALGFYVLSISLGLVLRVAFLHRFEGLVFGNALHAHSHTLYFGWGGLCLSAAWFAALDRDGKVQRWALGALTAIAISTFTAFLHSGYHLPGIVVSSLALLVWGWLAVLLWRAARTADGAARGFLGVAVVYLALAVASATARAVLLAAKVEDPMWGSLAVFGFVHNFAWFLFLGAVGLLRHRAPALGLSFDDRALRRQLWVIGGFAWLTVPLGVAGAQSGVMGIAARIGAAAVAASMLLWAWQVWRASRQAPVALKWASLWMVLWSVAYAGSSLGGAFGLAPLATAFRHPVIIYLHIFLVGLVTVMLFVLASATTEREPAGTWLHNAGLTVMLAGLTLASARFLISSLPLETITVGLWIAAIGAAVLVLAGVEVLLRHLRPSRSPAQLGAHAPYAGESQGSSLT